MAWGVAFEGSSGSDKLTTPEEFRLPVMNIFGPGMLAGGAVTQRSAGANTSVDVSALTAVVQGPATLGGTTRYLVTNDADDNTGSIGSAPGSNFRNDIIGVYQEDPDAPGSSDTLRMPRHRVISGAGHSVATSPGAAYGATGDPALPDRFQALARVRWSAGMVSIQNAQIDDLRSWAVLARDVVDDVNATRLGTHLGVPDTVVRRDGGGRVGVANPVATTDAVNKATLDALAAQSGGTLSGGTLGYRKLGSGTGATVYVWGRTNGATLPSGFRPAAELHVAGSDANTQVYRDVGIATSGTIDTGGNSVWINATFAAA